METEPITNVFDERAVLGSRQQQEGVRPLLLVHKRSGWVIVGRNKANGATGLLAHFEEPQTQNKTQLLFEKTVRKMVSSGGR